MSKHYCFKLKLREDLAWLNTSGFDSISEEWHQLLWSWRNKLTNCKFCKFDKKNKGVKNLRLPGNSTRVHGSMMTCTNTPRVHKHLYKSMVPWNSSCSSGLSGERLLWIQDFFFRMKVSPVAPSGGLHSAFPMVCFHSTCNIYIHNPAASPCIWPLCSSGHSL